MERKRHHLFVGLLIVTLISSYAYPAAAAPVRAATSAEASVALTQLSGRVYEFLAARAAMTAGPSWWPSGACTRSS